MKPCYTIHQGQQTAKYLEHKHPYLSMVAQKMKTLNT